MAKGKRHFVTMAGLRGCIPNYLSWSWEEKEAVEDLASVHELGRRRKRELADTWMLDLQIERDGNEYCQIDQCWCENPDINHRR